uniref:PDZ domain-containing protein n=1 Tax=Phytophthora ramorum TaxID=164328 RepID=H3GSC0_PHYRM
MADPRGDSACSEDSAFGDDTLSQDEFVQHQMNKMRSLEEVENTSFLESAPSRSSNHSGTSELSANLTVYEKLQALALAENIKFDGSTTENDDTKEEEEEEEEEEEDDDTYEISWDGGPLGLLFKANANGQPVIRRVNKKGAATGLQYARAGDVLLALNGISVEATPFSDVIEQLKNPEFPIKLDFRPLKLSDLASAASAATTQWGLPRTGSSIHSSDATSAFCGSPVSSNATVDLRSNRGGGWGDAGPMNMPQVDEALAEDPSDVEYDVVWSEGPLGCEMKQRNGLPTVKSVTGTGVTPSVAQIAGGDILVSINGLRTEEIGFKSTVTLMMRATKPVYLRFHRGGARQPPSTGNSFSEPPPSYRGGQSNRGIVQDVLPPAGPEAAALESKQYTVLWRDGPLGIQIRTSSKGRVVVARLTGAGAPNVNDTVKPGDVFVRVAGVDVDSLGIAGAFELLKTVQKPVVLVFQRRGRSSSRRSHSRGRGPGLPAPPPPPAPLPSSSIVPSFRQLREEEAAAAAAAAGRPPIARTHSGGYSPARPRNKSRGGSMKQFTGNHLGGYSQELENYAASDDGASQQSYDYMGDSPRSCASHQQQHGHLLNVDASGYDDGLPGYSDLPPPPPFPGTEPHAAGDEDYPEEDSFPPDASRDESPSLTGLPPPPSYMDVFTASGRVKDSPIEVPPSTRSMDLHNIPDDESAPGQSDNGYYGGHLERPPPFEAHSNDPLPPPPVYSEATFPPTDEESSILGKPSRLQELRRQYIESERERNLLQNGNATMVSTYSDIDDSGLVVRHKRQASYDGAIPESAPAPQLPLPELWVRWSEGPLGITFKRKNGQIVVSRLTGSGYSPGLTQLRAGDWLVSFNNQSTRNLRLGETMELLKRSPKPVDMCFIVQ